MDIKRAVNTHFWDDPYIVNLDPSEKLLYLYLLTNPLSNLCGIYEISIRRISFDTGFENDMVKKLLNRFSADKKIYYHKNYIILKNFLKNQKLNSNMEIGVQKIVDNLPDDVYNFIKDLNISELNVFLSEDVQSLSKPSKAFQNLREIESEIESEIEIEIERESEKEIESATTPLIKNIKKYDEKKYGKKIYFDIVMSFYKLFLKNTSEADSSQKHLKEAKFFDWQNEVRRMIEIDKISEKQFRTVYAVLKTDEFWKKNCVSILGLRKKKADDIMKFDKILRSAKKIKKPTLRALRGYDEEDNSKPDSRIKIS